MFYVSFTYSHGEVDRKIVSFTSVSELNPSVFGLRSCTRVCFMLSVPQEVSPQLCFRCYSLAFFSSPDSVVASYPRYSSPVFRKSIYPSLLHLSPPSNPYVFPQSCCSRGILWIVARLLLVNLPFEQCPPPRRGQKKSALIFISFPVASILKM